MEFLQQFRVSWQQELQHPDDVAAAATPPPTSTQTQQHCKLLDVLEPVGKRPKRHVAGPNAFLKQLIDDFNDEDDEDYFGNVIPADVVSLVFLYLDLYTLAACCLVCRAWRDKIYSEDRIWRKKAFELGFVARDDVSIPDVGWHVYVRNNLEQRRESTRRWRELLGAFDELAVASPAVGDIRCCVMKNGRVVTVRSAATYFETFDHPAYSPQQYSLAVADDHEVVALDIDAKQCIFATASGQLFINDVDAMFSQALALRHDVSHVLKSGTCVVAVGPGGVSGLKMFDAGLEEQWLSEGFGKALDVNAIHETSVFSLLTSTTCCLTDIATGCVRARLHDSQLNASASLLCHSSTELSVALGYKDIDTDGIKLFDTETGAFVTSMDTTGRPVSCIEHDGSASLLAGGYRCGVRLFDLRSKKSHQLLEAGYIDRAIRYVCHDDWKVVTLDQHVGFGRVAGKFRVSVTDRRMHKELWHIRSASPIRSCMVTPTHLLYCSASNNAISNNAIVPSENCFLNAIDFSAPMSLLADARCPFSSMYDDIHGWDWSLELATPFDAVDPDRLG